LSGDHRVPDCLLHILEVDSDFPFYLALETPTFDLTLYRRAHEVGYLFGSFACNFHRVSRYGHGGQMAKSLPKA
jgi:hypothetical protein